MLFQDVFYNCKNGRRCKITFVQLAFNGVWGIIFLISGGILVFFALMLVIVASLNVNFSVQKM